MKLKNIFEYSGHASSFEGYEEYMKDKGHEFSLNHGRKGFILVTFHPDKKEKTYPTLSTAKKAAPRHHHKHWLVIDGKRGKVVAAPEWWLGSHHMDMIRRANY